MTKFSLRPYQALGASLDAKGSHFRGRRGAPEERRHIQKEKLFMFGIEWASGWVPKALKRLYFPYSHMSDTTSWVMTITKDHIFTCQIWRLLNELGISTHMRSWSWLWSNGENDIYWTISTTMQILVVFLKRYLFKYMFDASTLWYQNSGQEVRLASCKSLLSSSPQSWPLSM